MTDTFYKYRRPLSSSYWKSPNNYDDFQNRRSHAITIQCCMEQYPLFRKLAENKKDFYIQEIERSCYNYTCKEADEKCIVKSWDNKKFVYIYNLKAYKVSRNLTWDKKIKNSYYLIDKITRGEFLDFKNIADMTEIELNPLKFKKINDSINIQRNQTIVKKCSKIHKCYVCGSEKTTEHKVFTRRCGDEDYTLKVRCEECFNEWNSEG